MWCDDFDMDVLKVVPGAAEILAPTCEIQLVTLGGVTDGKLNHPSAWNGDEGFDAFFGTAGTDRGLWLPSGYMTCDALVECTGEEAIRDWWANSYTMYLNTHRVSFHPDRTYLVFDRIMSHIRSWKSDPSHDGTVLEARNILVELVDRMQKIMAKEAVAQ